MLDCKVVANLQIELVNCSGKVVISSSQDMTKLANTVLHEDAEDAWLAD